MINKFEKPLEYSFKPLQPQQEDLAFTVPFETIVRATLILWILL